MTAELQTTEQTTEQTTAQALIQILTLNKNTGAALEKLLKLPLLDADNKIPAGVLRIVGALSQGYVIESGDNANGYYVRFADGTQICVMSEETTPAENSTQYGKQCTFPAAFYSTENLVLVASAGDMMSLSEHASTMTECRVLDASTYNVKMVVASDGGLHAPSVTWPFYACAIGRWKE